MLVIGVERLTDITDLDTAGTAFFFADGAGAVGRPLRRARYGSGRLGLRGEQFDLIQQTRGLARRPRAKDAR